MVRAAYTLHAEDDDWGQAGAMVREFSTMRPGTAWCTTSLGTSARVSRSRRCRGVFEYRRNVDHDLGTKVEEGSGLNNLAFATEPQPGMIETHDGVDVSAKV